MEIALDLQAQIEQGTLTPGDRLPTERELADRWHASTNTIKKAVNELRKRGRVETVPQKGSFVTEPAAYDQNGEPFRLTVTVYKPGANKIRFIAGEVPDEVWELGS